MEYFIARDKNTELFLYYDEKEPERTDIGTFWRGNVIFPKKYIKLNKESFPEVTFENSPRKVKIELV